MTDEKSKHLNVNLLFSLQTTSSLICLPFHQTWMTTTPMLQNGGWMWAESSRTLWSRYGSEVFLWKPLLYSGKYCQCLTGPLTVCKCSVTSLRLWDMNLTFMMINDKARGRRGVKIQFKSMLMAVARTHTLWVQGRTVTRFWMKHGGTAYRGINVSMCLMRRLHWPGGMLATCQVQDMLQTHTWHVRYRFLPH